MGRGGVKLVVVIIGGGVGAAMGWDSASSMGAK